ERHPRRLVLDRLPPRRHETEARDDEMCLACQVLEHPFGGARVGGLPVDAPAEHDRRVDAEYRAIACLAGDRLRLLARMSTDDLDDVAARRILFLILLRHDIERDAELRQDRGTLRRRRLM